MKISNFGMPKNGARWRAQRPVVMWWSVLGLGCRVFVLFCCCSYNCRSSCCHLLGFIKVFLFLNCNLNFNHSLLFCFSFAFLIVKLIPLVFLQRRFFYNSNNYWPWCPLSLTELNPAHVIDITKIRHQQLFR